MPLKSHFLFLNGQYTNVLAFRLPIYFFMYSIQNVKFRNIFIIESNENTHVIKISSKLKKEEEIRTKQLYQFYFKYLFQLADCLSIH